MCAFSHFGIMGNVKRFTGTFTVTQHSDCLYVHTVAPWVALLYIDISFPAIKFNLSADQCFTANRRLGRESPE